MCENKKPYPTYGEALAALWTLVSRPELGSVYECGHCEAWQVPAHRRRAHRLDGHRREHHLSWMR